MAHAASESPAGVIGGLDCNSALHVAADWSRSGEAADSVWRRSSRLEALFMRTPAAVNDSGAARAESEIAELAGAYGRSWTLDDYAAQMRAMGRHDLSAAFGGELSRSASAVRARMLIVHTADDHMVSAGPALEFARLAGAETLAVRSECGHSIFRCEKERIGVTVRRFLLRGGRGVAGARVPTRQVCAAFAKRRSSMQPLRRARRLRWRTLLDHRPMGAHCTGSEGNLEPAACGATTLERLLEGSALSARRAESPVNAPRRAQASSREELRIPIPIALPLVLARLSQLPPPLGRQSRADPQAIPALRGRFLPQPISRPRPFPGFTASSPEMSYKQ